MRISRALPTALLSLTLLLTALPATPLAAQTTDAPEDDVDAELIGYTPIAEPLAIEDWVDPVTQFELDPEDLEPLPDFDVADLHDSTVFAAGVDLVAVIDEDLEPHIQRHRQVMQAMATLDRLIDENAEEISQRRPRVVRLISQIDEEHRNEARLADEISLYRRAVAEYAVQTFIGEDELETALDIPDTGFSVQRVLSDEVRDGQLRQITNREAELLRRKEQRGRLENDLKELRLELDRLRQARTPLVANRRAAEEILPHTASAYQVALHERLPTFVEGTDIPLVALNAYVLAERQMAETQPTCQIEWWMLAGIGRIESFHGHFGDSTLNVNGHTTDAIYGPALDGRILSGEEFLIDGAVAPEATGRTEAQAVEPNPTPETPPAAIASTEGAEAGDPNSVSLGENGEPVAPEPVIKRLALIRDTDGGALDDDTTYDRAVGPMQFIPQTWNRFEADGNADEKSDPQNIYDAAMASATYLCAATSTMTTIEGRELAYFAYNHDEEYTANVEASGQRYREQIEISTEPFGTVHALGIANPDNTSPEALVAQTLRSLERLTLLDW